MGAADPVGRSYLHATRSVFAPCVAASQNEFFSFIEQFLAAQLQKLGRGLARCEHPIFWHFLIEPHSAPAAAAPDNIAEGFVTHPGQDALRHRRGMLQQKLGACARKVVQEDRLSSFESEEPGFYAKPKARAAAARRGIGQCIVRLSSRRMASRLPVVATGAVGSTMAVNRRDAKP